MRTACDAMKNKPTLNISQLSALVGVSLRTMYNMVGDGRCPVNPIEKTKPRRWNRSDVEKWLSPTHNGSNND
jgi:predicted DNA-binding transcriptional regulator AlpA